MKKVKCEKPVDSFEMEQGKLALADQVLRIQIMECHRKIVELEEVSERIELSRRKLVLKQLSARAS